MAFLILELVVYEDMLFSLYPAYVALSLFCLCFSCYSQVVRDDIFGDCSFYFAFVVCIINIQKNNEECLFNQIESNVSKMI